MWFNLFESDTGIMYVCTDGSTQGKYLMIQMSSEYGYVYRNEKQNC